MVRIFTLAVLFAFSAACGPMNNNEGQYPVPKTYPNKDKYTSPEEIPAEDLEKITPGSPGGPSEMIIDGRSIIFPVNGEAKFQNDWGAPRKGHTHQGTDVFAKKMIPVVAIADGQVNWLHRKGKKCCAIEIGHSNGWNTRYIHLNNDSSPKVDDGKGDGVAPHLKVGTKVRAGEVIGWVGDSGNAESSSPHLHFELRYMQYPINPYTSLTAAKRLPSE